MFLYPLVGSKISIALRHQVFESEKVSKPYEFAYLRIID